ncbi:ribokinase, partial [Pseudomonas syringae pv. syringae]
SVAMIGCVGADAYGEQLRAALLAEQIDCQAVTVVEGVSTGIASIVVDANSQNAIVIVAGGNGRLTPALLERFDALLADSQIVICQLEVPTETVFHTLARARALGKTVILNPAPASEPLPASWYALIDYLIPNESEAQTLTGVNVDSPAAAENAASVMLAAGARNVIITLGEHGTLFANASGMDHIPARRVQAVDTTAAGDTFVGGFAAALSAGHGELQAIRFGQAAAAISVTRAGAQPSIPTFEEVQEFNSL